MIVDCFPFYNELELLELRLETLWNVVDKFVIVEANKTHQDNPKPYYFSENLERWSKYMSKIVVHKVDYFPEYLGVEDGMNGCGYAIFQRNCIADALANLEIADDDIILLSDVDEIPNANIIQQLSRLDWNGQMDLVILNTQFFYYYFNLRCTTFMNNPWENRTHGLEFSIRAMKYRNFKLQSPNEVRCRNNGFTIYNAGWHWSYFGGIDRIIDKIQNFGHPQYNHPHWTDYDRILECLKFGKDLYDRDLQFAPVEIDETFPPYIRENLAKYEKSIFKPKQPDLKVAVNKLRVGFVVDWEGVSGGNVCVYDYAKYNRIILGNESIVFVDRNKVHPLVLEKFSELNVVLYDSWTDLERKIAEHSIDVAYMIISGRNTGLHIKGCRNVFHAVFECEPHGDKYAMVSEWLSKQNNFPYWVPHMVDMPDNVSDDLRKELGIPEDAVVFGRHGSYDTFDIDFVRIAIRRALVARDDLYFVFLNTPEFYKHPRIFYLSAETDIIKKNKFINTCDAMIHARARGETFGLAVAEFSSKNKPVYSYFLSQERAHIDILGNRGVYYSNEEEIFLLLLNHQKEYGKEDWNQYKAFAPQPVMERFRDTFLK